MPWLSKGDKNGIGGGLLVVDFPGAGAGFARDSNRAEGPTAGPNTEFLKVGSSYEQKLKRYSIFTYKGFWIAGGKAAGGSGSVVTGGTGIGSLVFGSRISDAGEELFALARVLGRGRGRAATAGADVAVWGSDASGVLRIRSASELSAVKALSVRGKSAASRVGAAGVEGLADKVDAILWNAHHHFLKKIRLLLTWEQLWDYRRWQEKN
jgi:hypothetical protein